MRLLNILRLTPYYYFDCSGGELWDLNYEPVGGMQVQIYEQTRAVSQLGHRQTLLTIGLPGIPRKYSSCNNIRIISVRLPQLPIKYEAKGMVGLLPAWAFGAIGWSIKQRLKRKPLDIDMIHGHCSELSWPAIAAIAVSKILKKKLAITIHCSAIYTSHPSSFWERVFLPLARWAEKVSLKKPTV